MLHSVIEAGRGGENAQRARKSIGISSLACPEIWVKMRPGKKIKLEAIEAYGRLEIR